MTKKEKITVEKDKKRIPVPQKPPKAEEKRNAYKRNKEKEEARKIVKGENEDE